MQNTFHSALGCSPNELVNRKSKFDKENKVLPDLLPVARNRSIIQNNKNLSLLNKHRKCGFRYKIGDLVWKNINIRTKYNEYFTGPYTIKEISKEGTTLLLEKDNHQTQAHITQIRPAKIEAEL